VPAASQIAKSSDIKTFSECSPVDTSTKSNFNGSHLSQPMQWPQRPQQAQSSCLRVTCCSLQANNTGTTFEPLVNHAGAGFVCAQEVYFMHGVKLATVEQNKGC